MIGFNIGLTISFNEPMPKGHITAQVTRTRFLVSLWNRVSLARLCREVRGYHRPFFICQFCGVGLLEFNGFLGE